MKKQALLVITDECGAVMGVIRHNDALTKECLERVAEHHFDRESTMISPYVDEGMSVEYIMKTIREMPLNESSDVTFLVDGVQYDCATTKTVIID